MNSVYDCIVIGGGPAGCTTATLLSQAGWKTLLLERERVPRFHVGESLMPETYWTFERLGVLEKLKNSSFVRKSSVRFVSHADNSSQWIHFRDHDPRECSTTWQVERADFDKLLFENAQAQGVECHDQSPVLDIIFQQQRAVGVRMQRAAESVSEIRARVIVDASGQQTLLANQLHLRTQKTGRCHIAVWGYYRDADREEGENGGATVLLQTTTKKSWFWFVPLQNNITSIGVVGDRNYLAQGRCEPAAIFEDQLVACPMLTERLLKAELHSELRLLKQPSYCVTERAGDGWVLVGDAAGFSDPTYSSGMLLAFKSAEMAADTIDAALRQNEVSGQHLGSWTTGYDRGATWLRKLGEVFNSPEFSLSRFLRDYPQYRGPLTDLLMGRAFQANAGHVFEALELMRIG